MSENKFYAQGFTPSKTPLSKVRLPIFKFNNPPENAYLTISIRDALAGEDIVSSQIYLDDLTEGYIDYSFPDIDVATGYIYYIICSVDKGYLRSDCYAWRYSPFDKYESGDAWYSINGITWYPAEEYTLEKNPGVDCGFTTYWPDYGPDACEIYGPTEGTYEERYDYIFSTTDPEGHDVQYYIEWGDGSDLKWIGPYNSGEEVTKGHAWLEEGNYTIRIKAKDKYGATCEDWTEIEVNMPKTKINSSPFLTFLENHPHLFPLLRQILGL
jgi:hypothetical protein